MISIKKDFKNPPELLLKSKRNEYIKDSIITKNEHKFNGGIYGNKTKESLKILYKFKCAYCETDTTAGAPLQVEHFRPKAKTDGDLEHNGYYWLAYEWSNLTLGCSTCNRNKGNHFPITGKRIYLPLLGSDNLPTNEYLYLKSKTFLAEKALLLNPEIDEVEKSFSFSPQGKIIALDERGEETINKLDLNRDRLLFWRRKLLDRNLAKFRRILDDFHCQIINIEQCRYAIRLIFEHIESLQNPEKQYSRFGYYMFHEFDVFFINEFESKQKEAISRFFDLFKSGEL